MGEPIHSNDNLRHKGDTLHSAKWGECVLLSDNKMIPNRSCWVKGSWGNSWKPVNDFNVEPLAELKP